MSNPRKKKTTAKTLVNAPTEEQIQELASKFEKRCKNLNADDLRKLISAIGITNAEACLNEDCRRVVDCLKAKEQTGLNIYSRNNPYDASKV